MWELKSWQFLCFPPIFTFLDTFTALLRMMRKGMATLRRQKTGLQYVFYVYLSISVAYSYNIDLEHPLVFRGPNSSFFGYSVLEHYHDNTRWWVPFCFCTSCWGCSEVQWSYSFKLICVLNFLLHRLHPIDDLSPLPVTNTYLNA